MWSYGLRRIGYWKFETTHTHDPPEILLKEVIKDTNIPLGHKKSYCHPLSLEDHYDPNVGGQLPKTTCIVNFITRQQRWLESVDVLQLQPHLPYVLYLLCFSLQSGHCPSFLNGKNYLLKKTMLFQNNKKYNKPPNECSNGKMEMGIPIKYTSIIYSHLNDSEPRIS